MYVHTGSFHCTRGIWIIHKVILSQGYWVEVATESIYQLRITDVVGDEVRHFNNSNLCIPYCSIDEIKRIVHIPIVDLLCYNVLFRCFKLCFCRYFFWGLFWKQIFPNFTDWKSPWNSTKKTQKIKKNQETNTMRSSNLPTLYCMCCNPFGASSEVSSLEGDSISIEGASVGSLKCISCHLSYYSTLEIISLLVTCYWKTRLNCILCNIVCCICFTTLESVFKLLLAHPPT